MPLLLDQDLDTPASFDHIQKAGSLLGSAGLIVLDDTVCMVWLAMNLLHFYRHESCGKCTPCREGGDWLYKLLQRVERGEGQTKDLDLLFGVSNNIVGKTLCAFGDAAATPVLSTMKLFRDEYEAHVREGRCTLPAEWRARSRCWRDITDVANLGAGTLQRLADRRGRASCRVRTVVASAAWNDMDLDSSSSSPSSA